MSQGRQYGKVFTPIKGAGVVLMDDTVNTATATQNFHLLDDSAGLVQLDTLNGMEIGDEVTLLLATGMNGAVITGIGNLILPLGSYVRLLVETDYVVLKRNSPARWSVITQSVASVPTIDAILDAAGDFTVTDRIHQLGGFGAADDTLRNIAGGSQGQKLRVVRGGQNITVGGAGNVRTSMGTQFVLGTVNDSFDAVFDTTAGWVVTAINIANENAGAPINVAGGTLAATRAVHLLAGGGATATLATINGGVGGRRLRLISAGDPDVIVLSEAGNIKLPLGINAVLYTTGDYADLSFDELSNSWVVLSVYTAIDSAETVGVAGGNLPALYRNIAVSTPGGIANLDNITTVVAGQRLTLTVAGPGPDPVVLRDQQGGPGQIHTPNGQSIHMGNASDWIELYCDGQDWYVIGYNLQWMGLTADAPPSNVYIQFSRINHGDLTATAATQAINLGSALPAGAEVLDVVMDTRILWTCAGGVGVLAAANLSIGTTAALDGVRAAANIIAIAATGRGIRPVKGPGVGGLQIIANCVGSATGTGTSLAGMSAGQADFYVMYTILPTVP
jgi:hypothetical protein